MKCGIYVRLYNEKNIIEWMEYHYKCGFDFILFYDDYSEPSVKTIIEDYGKFDKNKYLVLERLYPKIGTTKISCGLSPKIFKETFLPYIQKHMDYVLYIDMDEYLYMDKFNSIQELIKSYGDFDMLYIYWKYFGSQNKKSNNNEKLLNNYTFSYNNISNCGKSLCKVKSIKTSNNPHFFLLKNNNKIMNIYNNEFKYETDLTTKQNFKKNITNNIYIAHYYFLDIESFLNKRFFTYNKEISKGGWSNQFLSKHIKEIYNYNYTKNKNELIERIFNYKNNFKNYKLNDNIDFETHISQLYWSICINLKKYNTDLLDFYNKKL